MIEEEISEIVESFSKDVELKRIIEIPRLTERIGKMLSCIAKESGPIIDLREKDLYLLLNPHIDFYASFFRPNGSKQEFRGFQQQIIEATLKHGSMDRRTRNIIPIEDILKRLHKKYVHRSYDDDYNNSPIGVMRKQIFDNFIKAGMKYIGVPVIEAYVDMVERKMDECHIRRNFDFLEGIYWADLYGEDDAKKFSRIGHALKTFETGVSDVIEYIIRMPEAFNRYYRRNPFVFKGENCAGMSCSDFVNAIQKSTHSLEDTIKICRSSGRYDADRIREGLQEADSGLMIKEGFFRNMQRLIGSAECLDEQEILEVASLEIKDYEGLRKLGSGAIKTAFLARNIHTKDEVVFLQINNVSDDPGLTRSKHYNKVYPDISPEDIEDKVLEAEFSSTKLRNIEDKKYIAVIDPPVTGKSMGEEHFFLQVSGKYEKTLEDAMRNNEITPEKAIKYFYQLCYALDNCHKAGIVHKDLKFGNIGITSDDNILLSDFGCVNIFSEDADCRYQHPLTLRPPEMAHCGDYWKQNAVASQSELFTPEANVWSCGRILYIMLTGEDDFRTFEKRAEIGTDEYHKQNEEVCSRIQKFCKDETFGREIMIEKIIHKQGESHKEEYETLIELCIQAEPGRRKGALERCKEIAYGMMPKTNA